MSNIEVNVEYAVVLVNLPDFKITYQFAVCHNFALANFVAKELVNLMGAGPMCTIAVLKPATFVLEPDSSNKEVIDTISTKMGLN